MDVLMNDEWQSWVDEWLNGCEGGWVGRWSRWISEY
jgi:hypothetical protein